MVRLRDVIQFALFGVISGAITTVLYLSIPRGFKISFGYVGALSPGTVLPGLIFGIVVGGLLKYRGLVNTRTAVLYALGSTAANFVAIHLATNNIFIISEPWQIGMTYGFLGGAFLTAATMVILPFVWRIGPIALMFVSGGPLGALWEIPYRLDSGGWLDSSNWSIFFIVAVWQAGYAAAFATALPPAVEG